MTSGRAVTGSPRQGITLLEILLVLGLLALAAGLSLPAIMGFVRDKALRSGADAVRSALQSTRLRAMERGEAYSWRFEPGGRWFAAVPRDPIGSSATAGAGGTGTDSPSGQGATTASTPATPGERVWVLLGELPEGVAFPATDGAAGGTIDLKLLEGLPGAERLRPETVWSAPWTFSVDGSSNGGEITLTDARSQSLKISLRALTGTVTLGPIETATR
jgi:Tfp pilus assembly protein FimT